MPTNELTTTAPLSQAEMDLILGAYSQNVDQQAEVQIHRLAIEQPGSPEVSGSIAGYKAGQLVNNKTRDILTTERKQPWLIAKGVPEAELSSVHCTLVVVCMKLPTEFVKWIPKVERKDGDPMWKFKTLDGSDPRVRAGVWANRGGSFGRSEDERGKRPPVTDHINFLIAAVDDEKQVLKSNFIIDSFSRTSADAGKLLTTYIQGHNMMALPPWGQTYWLYTKKAFNESSNSWYHYQQIAPGPLLKDVCPMAEPLIRSMALWLADKTHGRSRQETLLNMAEIESSEEAGVNATGDGQTVEGQVHNPLGGAEDPFAGEAVAKPTF